jgi:hypothetical protein
LAAWQLADEELFGFRVIFDAGRDFDDSFLDIANHGQPL